MLAADATRDNPDYKVRPLRRREFRIYKDIPAVIKMYALMARNKEMKTHTAARMATRYATGNSPDATARRLVKRFNRITYNCVGPFFHGDKDVLEGRVHICEHDYIIAMKLVDIIEEITEKSFARVLKFSDPFLEMIFSYVTFQAELIQQLHTAMVIVSMVRPGFFLPFIPTLLSADTEPRISSQKKYIAAVREEG